MGKHAHTQRTVVKRRLITISHRSDDILQLFAACEHACPSILSVESSGGSGSPSDVESLWFLIPFLLSLAQFWLPRERGYGLRIGHRDRHNADTDGGCRQRHVDCDSHVSLFLPKRREVRTNGFTTQPLDLFFLRSEHYYQTPGLLTKGCIFCVKRQVARRLQSQNSKCEFHDRRTHRKCQNGEQ